MDLGPGLLTYSLASLSGAFYRHGNLLCMYTQHIQIHVYIYVHVYIFIQFVFIVCVYIYVYRDFTYKSTPQARALPRFVPAPFLQAMGELGAAEAELNKVLAEAGSRAPA